ncbi:ArsR/SmtB family transcription factor [Sphaerisporangium rubeum]|uniref:DNA-binding transcriptional ArsR family regulator n=1 Tax=Sphaerisporangium rubeum TaxID=321317 RepID=A0A7X0M5A0_9ACTN|nr:helix-turn-helix domain-containing protein [Sphaerisporangium rubeum]MBB6472398.1 DNA-binding transcriptional ArsR family regulator [Sphaerisporangium rubeum]
MNRPSKLVEDPRAMRALAHPARLAILKRLQLEGPATATECAAVAGISASAGSYHLRMLAKYGFVEDAPPRGDGRERVWQAPHRGFTVPEPDDQTPELAEAKNVLAKAVLDGLAEDVRRYLDSSVRESKEWRQAATLNQMTLRVNAEELAELGRKVTDILLPYLARTRGPEAAPPDARVIQGVVHLYPRPPA